MDLAVWANQKDRRNCLDAGGPCHRIFGPVAQEALDRIGMSLCFSRKSTTPFTKVRVL
jgi:hypothetical protein